MSVVTGIDGKIGFSTTHKDISYGVELIYQHGQDNLEAFIEQNP